MKYLLFIFLFLSAFADDRTGYTNLLQFEQRTTNPPLAPTGYVTMFFDGVFKYINSAGTVTSLAGTGGVGDVVGPASAVINNIATYNATTGKLIKDSGRAINTIPYVDGNPLPATSNIVLGGTAAGTIGLTPYKVPSTICANDEGLKSNGTDYVCATTGIMYNSAAAANKMAIFTDATGTQLKGSGYTVPSVVGAAGQILVSDGTNLAFGNRITAPAITAVNHVAQFADTTGTVLQQTPYTLPISTGTLGQVLASDGIGAVNWVTPAPAATGDVAGPATSADNTISLFSGTTGKLLKGTPYTIPLTVGTNGQFLKSDGTNVIFTNPPAGGSGDVVGPASSVNNTLPLFNGVTGKLLKATPYTMPTTVGASGLVLKSDGTNVTFQADNSGAGGGDVTGPASAVAYNFAVFADTTGKKLAASSYSLSEVITRATPFSGANRVILSEDNISNNIIESAYALPIADGAANFVLKTNGSGAVSWQPDAGGAAGAGDVQGPAVAIINEIAVYKDVSGKIIESPASASTSTAPLTYENNALSIGSGANQSVRLSGSRPGAGFDEGTASLDLYTFGSVLPKISLNNSQDGNSSVTIQGPMGDGFTSSLTLTLPRTGPTANGQLLQGTTGGYLSWTASPLMAYVDMGASNSIDARAGTLYFKSIAVATTLSIAGFPGQYFVNGMQLTIVITNTTAGALTVTFPAAKWKGGTAANSVLANSTSIFIMRRINGLYYITPTDTDMR